MALSTSLAADIRSQLENVRQILSLSQGELAGLAGISQGNVSNCLQGKPVKIESLRRLLSAFASQVASASDKDLSAEQILELRKSVDTARKAVDGSVEIASYFARPGGPMPENATNRIQRPEDKRLLAALDDAPFTAAIVGPPECGKTTTLQLLVEEARRRGFTVVDFDSQILEDVTLEERREDRDVLLTARFLPELAAEVGRMIGEKPPESMNTSLEVVRFLRDTRFRRPAPPLLIAVDHTTTIPLAVETLVQVCRTLDSQKGRTQMSWIIEAGDLLDAQKLGALSRLAPSPMIEMGWLSEAQVREFSGLYDIQSTQVIEELWDWFLGQPILTHLALDRFRNLGREGITTVEGCWEAVQKEIRAQRGEFWRHFRKFRERTKGRNLLQNGESATEFVERCKHSANLRDWAEHRGFLHPGNSILRMPLFYQHHFSALYVSHT